MRTFYTISVVLATVLCATPAAAQSPQERLWDAAIAGDTGAIRAAITAGADVNALDTRRNPNGRRALNWAALNGHSAAITLLLSLGAELEGVNNTGFSALSHAAEAGALEAARTLLAAGADPAHPNNEGWLPADIARERGHAAVVQLLEDAADDD
jgi:ankyrin repeat protein